MYCSTSLVSSPLRPSPLLRPAAHPPAARLFLHILSAPANETCQKNTQNYKSTWVMLYVCLGGTGRMRGPRAASVSPSIRGDGAKNAMAARFRVRRCFGPIYSTRSTPRMAKAEVFLHSAGRMYFGILLNIKLTKNQYFPLDTEIMCSAFVLYCFHSTLPHNIKLYLAFSFLKHT